MASWAAYRPTYLLSVETDSISVFEDGPEADVSDKVPFTPPTTSVNNHVSKLVVELENGNRVTNDRNDVQSGTRCDVILNHGPATTTQGRHTTTADVLTKITEGIPNCFDHEYATHLSSSIPNSGDCAENGKSDFDPGSYVSSCSGFVFCILYKVRLVVTCVLI